MSKVFVSHVCGLFIACFRSFPHMFSVFSLHVNPLRFNVRGLFTLCQISFPHMLVVFSPYVNLHFTLCRWYFHRMSMVLSFLTFRLFSDSLRLPPQKIKTTLSYLKYKKSSSDEHPPIIAFPFLKLLFTRPSIMQKAAPTNAETAPQLIKQLSESMTSHHPKP